MNPIAIIGVGCIFPGANNPTEFWDHLIHGRDLTTDATPDRWGADPADYYDPTRRNPDATYFLRGGYVQDSPTPNPESAGDRALRWTLDVARMALTDAQRIQRADLLRRCGLILGALSFPTETTNRLFTPLYADVIHKALAQGLRRALDKQTEAIDDNLILADPAALTARTLGLRGLTLSLDAACASSIYSVALASHLLNLGQADLMLAGAVSAADPLFINLGFSHLSAYPEPGRDSHPLDATSDGLISGEGAGMFVLKRLADARRDGDRIYAVVRGFGLTNDGRGKHVLTPNSKGQVQAIERAYAGAGIDPAQVAYIECHASGTPLGDKTELNSMEIFFGRSGHYPRIGSVKSNLGHMLTAAGMASMLKVILSMTHDTIPATIGVRHPLTSQNGAFSGAQIVHQPLRWDDAGASRIAGINAFGFGGVSAHLILARDDGRGEAIRQPQATALDQAPVTLAITGMDAHFGRFDSLDAYARALYDGDTAFIPLPEGRWKGLQHHPALLREFGLDRVPDGAYIESFDLDFMRYRIPPNPGDEPIPQQLLLLKVADNAIRDAGLREGSRTAVIVALGTELSLHQYRARADLNWQVREALAAGGVHLPPDALAELERIAKDALLSPAQANHYASTIGNIAASRVAALWDFTGPAFTVSAEENSVFKALEIARVLLQSGEAEAVVVGAVDLAGGLESVLLHNLRAPAGTTIAAPFDREADGWLPGEGAGAVVLVRASQYAGPVYAVIDALAIDPSPAAAAREALTSAGIAPAQIGYLELAAGDPSTHELSDILPAYGGVSAPETAIGSARATVGHTGTASGMAALIKTALAIARRFIPAIPNWTGPADADLWRDRPFWAAHRSRTWFDATPRAAISAYSPGDGTAAHVILTGVDQAARDHQYRRGGSPYLFPIGGDTLDDLTWQIDALAGEVQRVREESAANIPALGSALQRLADEAFYVYRPDARYAVSIMGRDAKEVAAEIDRARAGVAAAFNMGGEWSTPAGSAFAADPVGREGRVAFVYPGAFNSYPKLGYDLFHLFPRAYDIARTIRSAVGEALHERLLYPRTLEKPGPKITNQMKTALASDAVAMIESGLGFAVVYTRIMKEYFGIQPHSAFGYSLGEGSMMWGQSVWQDGDLASTTLNSSPLFRTRLAGPMDAVRETWGIAAGTPADQFWAAYFIAAPVDRVREAVMHESKVYLTHINTPGEVMIAGEPAACERVVALVKAQGGESMRAPFDVAIHNEAMMGEYAEFYRLHDLPVRSRPAAILYSAADYAPLQPDRKMIASAISRMACKQVDFPRLIERAYADGARVFLELGPRSTCARWIDETLDERPHVAVSIDTLGAEDRVSLVKLLARLVAHRVPLDLSALYHPRPAEAGRKSLIRTVRLGGQDVYAAIVREVERAGLTAMLQPGMAPAPARPTIPPVRPSIAAPIMPAAQVTPRPDDVRRETASAWVAEASPITAAHLTFLETRRAALRQLGEIVGLHIDAAPTVATVAQTPLAAPSAPPIAPRHAPPAPSPAPAPSVMAGITPHYDLSRVQQFATGRVADCFGENYAIYDDRRAPRIPNGDLLLFTRAVAIAGERYKSAPGTAIHAEYDVPVDEWFYRDNPYPVMPYSVYMEIALQPCGFLSAYHGPTLAFPDIDFYFRNLDGQGRLHHDLDMRGRTITNHVKMLNTTIMQGIIIQKFDFKLYDGDRLFYEGDATFGYFTKEALNSQAGLDVGRLVPRWIDTAPLADYAVSQIDPRQPFGEGYLSLATGQLQFTDQIIVVPGGGKYGEGYAYANTVIDPRAWYFRNHFYQDPVMPGSIGVETILQAMQAYAIETGLGAGFRQPRFAQVDSATTPGGHNTVWKYRGQILSDSDKSHVEANIKRIERRADRVVIYADASLWRDKLRIYEVANLALAIVEG